MYSAGLSAGPAHRGMGLPPSLSDAGCTSCVISRLGAVGIPSSSADISTLKACASSQGERLTGCQPRMRTRPVPAGHAWHYARNHGGTREGLKICRAPNVEVGKGLPLGWLIMLTSVLTLACPKRIQLYCTPALFKALHCCRAALPRLPKRTREVNDCRLALSSRLQKNMGSNLREVVYMPRERWPEQ